MRDCIILIGLVILLSILITSGAQSSEQYHWGIVKHPSSIRLISPVTASDNGGVISKFEIACGYRTRGNFSHWITIQYTEKVDLSGSFGSIYITEVPVSLRGNSIDPDKEQRDNLREPSVVLVLGKESYMLHKGKRVETQRNELYETLIDFGDGQQSTAIYGVAGGETYTIRYPYLWIERLLEGKTLEHQIRMVTPTDKVINVLTRFSTRNINKTYRTFEEECDKL